MQPASPVIPGLEDREVVYAKDQPEYLPLPSLRTKSGHVGARWALTDEERALIAEGADVFLTLWTFNHPLQPCSLSVINVKEPTYLGAIATAQFLGLEELLIQPSTKEGA